MNTTGRKAVPRIPPVSMSGWRRIVLIIYIVLLFAAALYLIYAIWPVETAASGEQRPVFLVGRPLDIGFDLRLILLVVCAGLLGSCVHVATSFTSFSGNRTLVESWFWWYVLRPFIGMAVALILYFVMRGGLLMVGAKDVDLDPYAIAGLAGLAGMFSKQATDKLRELFDSLFRTAEGRGDDERRDKLGELMLAADAMIPRKRIVAIAMKEGTTAADVALRRLNEKFGEGVTRLPVFDVNGLVQCVVHRSTLHAFIVNRCCEGGQAQAGKPFDLDELTLATMLEEPDIRALAVESLGFVPLEATIADAKATMDATENCQDVFVTATGRRDEPVVGWLTNVDIERSLEA